MVLVLAGCRRAQGNIGPTLQPTLTPTPRSTPLPAIAPTIAPGSPENPLRMLIQRPQSALTQTALNRAVSQLQDALFEATDLIVEIQLVDVSADLIAALCSAPVGAPTVVWIGGLGYAVAAAQNCGSPVLQGRRGRGTSARSGEEIQIIVQRDSDIVAIADLENVTFCRLNSRDVQTWMMPALIMQANGFNAADLGALVDQPDIDALIEAVIQGECDAAGISASDFEQFASADARRSIRALSQTAMLPLPLLMYPTGLPLNVQQALEAGVVAVMAAEAAPLRALLGIDSVARVEMAPLETFTAFLRRTGLDLAQFGV